MKMGMTDAAVLEIEAAQHSTSSIGSVDALKEDQMRRRLIRSSSHELQVEVKALANMNSNGGDAIKSEACSRIDLSKDI